MRGSDDPLCAHTFARILARSPTAPKKLTLKIFSQSANGKFWIAAADNPGIVHLDIDWAKEILYFRDHTFDRAFTQDIAGDAICFSADVGQQLRSI